MKCQKCTQPAVVHLTELFAEGATKKAVELHLCYEHALECGLLVPPNQPTPTLPVHSHATKKAKPEAATASKLESAKPAPGAQPPAEMAMTRKEPTGATGISPCPKCGNTWQAFKTAGVMGCPHDYTHFESKLLPLVRRAHEGAVQHAGKVPQNAGNTDVTRNVTTSRLRRQLLQAIDAERYEEAAKLRDQLKQLGSN